jgi:bifunctional enzyme CysN/CysC
MSELLRLATAGSVDDGKSTLIGRLLYDSKAILADQLEAVERTSRERGDEYTNLALLTDGLRAEREQGITIDVAYRYFSTARRKFIIADTPGHIQYTRNMVTGASTADVALILIDARQGVLEQSRRHAFIASLLGIRHLVLCVNKMDLVGWSAERFGEIRDEFRSFAMKLEVGDLTFVPISALNGDNVVSTSDNMPWFEGPPLLTYLEQVHIASDRNLIDARFPVQYVIRPQSGTQADLHDYRGYAGTVSAGVFRTGDEVVVLPSGFSTRIAAIHGPGGAVLEEAFPPQSVTLLLADDLDVSRGDLICRPNNRPVVTRDVDAMVCWFSDRSTLAPSRRYILRHTTRSVAASVEALDYRLDVNTLHRDEAAGHLGLNEIGRVRLRTQAPVMLDEYRRSRATGSLILVDPDTFDTVGAGMVVGTDQAPMSPNVTWHRTRVERENRAAIGATIWFTGLSGSGKSTVAVEVERRLVEARRAAYLLDGDNLRHGLNADLGFSAADRAENVRRVGEVAKLFADAGLIAVVSLVSPFRADRNRVRAAHSAAGLRFIEVFVDTPLEMCEARDPKGLYARARAGDLPDFTGISSPYEPPDRAELVLRPGHGGPGAMADLVLARLGA